MSTGKSLVCERVGVGMKSKEEINTGEGWREGGLKS